MSTTDLVPFDSKSKPAAAFQAALSGAEPESLSEGIGSSYGIVGYKGKVWSLRYRGEKHTFTRPDDNSPAAHIDVIILRQGHVKSKSFYPSYNPDASEGVRPICASLDGIVPDDDVPEKQSNTCALCPRNVWKTGTGGKKMRECTDYKRLAVLVLPNQTTRLLGSPLMEPVFLRVPAGSLQDLGVYGDQLNAKGFHYSSVATRVSFDPDQPHPKMVFKAIQALTDAEAPVVLPMREDPLSLRITGEDVIRAVMGTYIEPKPDKTAVLPPPQESALGLTAAPEQPKAKAPPAEERSDVLDLKANVPDTGVAEESDDALDAKIKSILGG